MNFRKHILLVEDEAIISYEEKLLLEKYGYDVDTAFSGSEAVDKTLTSESFELVLMDINLGQGLSGADAAELILKSKDIPILFLSSHTDPEIVKKTELISSYGYVVKNSGITVLDASIKMAFRLYAERMNVNRKQSELSAANSLLAVTIAELESANNELSEANIRLEESAKKIESGINALRDSENNLTRFADAFTHCSHGIAMIEAVNAGIILCNPAFADILGFSTDEIPGTAIFSLFDRSESDHFIKHDWTKSNDKIRFEASIKNASENIVPVQVDISETRNLDGIILYRIATLLDISDRIKSEHKLLESRERYRSIIENSHDLIQTADESGNFLFVNRRWMETLEYGPEDFSRINFFSIVHPKSEESVKKQFKRLRLSNCTLRLGLQAVSKSGLVLSLDGTASSQIQPDGSYIINLFLMDITEQKRSDLIKTLRLETSIIISDSKPADTTLQEILGVVCRECGWDYGEFWQSDSENKRLNRLKDTDQSDLAAQILFVEKPHVCRWFFVIFPGRHSDVKSLCIFVYQRICHCKFFYNFSMRLQRSVRADKSEMTLMSDFITWRLVPDRFSIIRETPQQSAQSAVFYKFR